jgi:hypothetical protein
VRVAFEWEYFRIAGKLSRAMGVLYVCTPIRGTPILIKKIIIKFVPRNGSNSNGSTEIPPCITPLSELLPCEGTLTHTRRAPENVVCV